MYRFAKFAAGGAVVLLSACHEDGLGNHGCPLEYATTWRAYGLDVEHEEPAQCPVFLPQAGTRLRTGATVVDGGSRDFSRTQLLVENSVGAAAGDVYGTFGRDESGRWTSPTYTTYSAGTAALRPDHAYFDLLFMDGGLATGAHMTISYTDRLVASISGTTVIQPDEPQIHTWTAKVTQGVPPYQYRWYRDWELVSTSSAYSDIGADSMLLRLDVIDARGEVDSYSKTVVVNTCGGEYLC